MYLFEIHLLFIYFYNFYLINNFVFLFFFDFIKDSYFLKKEKIFLLLFYFKFEYRNKVKFERWSNLIWSNSFHLNKISITIIIYILQSYINLYLLIYFNELILKSYLIIIYFYLVKSTITIHMQFVK